MVEQRCLIGDCQVVMKGISSESVDMVLTSPPYDDLRDYGGNSQFDVRVVAKELWRVLKQGGVVVWVVGDKTEDGSETCTSFKQALAFREVGFNLHDTMIYEKAGFQNPSHNRYHQVFEYMFVFSKGKPKTFNPIKDRKNKWKGNWGANNHRKKDGTLEERKERIEQEEFGMRFNIWRYVIGYGNSSEDEIAYEHPAIFPDQLAIDQIKSWSNKEDTVLDPFVGSGTVLRACRILERNGIGIEINPEYEKIIKERIKENIPVLEKLSEKWFDG